jgi:hypothetical protein
LKTVNIHQPHNVKYFVTLQRSIFPTLASGKGITNTVSPKQNAGVGISVVCEIIQCISETHLRTKPQTGQITHPKYNSEHRKAIERQ